MFLLIPPFHLNFDILINLPFSLKFQHFDRLDILHSISTFWLILNVVLKFQYSDQFLIFQSNSNNLIDFHFCNRISTFDQSTPFLLKFQHFDRFDILHSNFNIVINSHLIALKRQLFDWFPTFHSKYNILNDLVISTQIWSFWLIPNFVLNFNILINSLFFNQIPTFWLIHTLAIKCQHLINIKFSLIFQHFDRFDILH